MARMHAPRTKKIEGDTFLLSEECQDEFDAHDAAHVYRAHEGLLCRIFRQPEDGSLAVYVGGARTQQVLCRLRWCPHREGGHKSMTFFEPRRPPSRRKKEKA